MQILGFHHSADSSSASVRYVRRSRQDFAGAISDSPRVRVGGGIVPSPPHSFELEEAMSEPDTKKHDNPRPSCHECGRKVEVVKIKTAGTIIVQTLCVNANHSEDGCES